MPASLVRVSLPRSPWSANVVVSSAPMRMARTRYLGFALLLLLSCHACASPRPAYRAATVEHGRLSQVDGFWVMQLDGSPAERGKAAGLLVGEQVRWLLPRYLKKVASVEKLSPAQKERVAALAEEIPRPHFEEVNAYAEAAGVDRTTLFAINMAPEMLAALACSCMAVAAERSSDAKVRLARNLDWPGGDLLAEAGLVVIESGGAHRFASIGWPGMVGVATGMNDAGVAIADLVALHTGGNRQPHAGVPVLLAVRGMLETAGSVDGALAWLKAARRTMPQNYALADGKDVRVVETSATRFEVRPAERGLAVITNFWNEDRGGAKDGRYARMLKDAGDGKLGSAELQGILAHAALREMNIQSVILEPETRKAHVAHGEPPVAAGTWRTIELGVWLGKN
jgi:isopenicillin-N N-acyltransferase like protein